MVNGEQPLLESWKEISAYLNRSVRTCRRWEETLGLPVHRLDGTPNARVFAYPAEIDRWLSEKLHHLEAEKEGPVPGLLRKPKRALAVAFGVVAAALVLAGAAVFVPPLLRPIPAPVPGANPTLAVFPFENPSGDKDLESWRTALPGLLMTDLRQSRYLDVVPLRSMYARLKDMKLAEAAALTDADIAAFVKRFEPDFTATGRLSRSGDGISVEVTVRAEKGGDRSPHVLRVASRGEKALIPRADALSRELKSAVGLTRSQIAADPDLPLRRIATAAPEALKLFSRAAWPREWGVLPEMGPALEKALAIDPGFGAARELLYAAHDSSQVEEKVRAYEQAVSQAERLSEREYLLLQASFYMFIRRQGGLAKMTGVGIPAATIDRLKPKTRGDALPVFERLAALYPGFAGSQAEMSTLVDIYMDAEEWDKAIALLETAAPMPSKGIPANTQKLIHCYLAAGAIEKAEAALANLEKSAPPQAAASSRREIALRKRAIGEFHALLDKAHPEAGPKGRPYIYHTARGYALWLADDLDGAEKDYRTAVPEAGPEVEAQRAVDLVALFLSQGKIAQALAEAARGLEIAENDKALQARGAPRRFHHLQAYLFRLAGRPREALSEAEFACRGCDREVPPGYAVELMSLRGRLLLEAGLTAEFERQLRDIEDLCAREACPKLMRAYHYLRGLQEHARGSGRKAIAELQKALDLSIPSTRQNDPSAILFAMAEVHESMGDRTFAEMCFEEIGKLPERGSFAGDVYALSFYRKAKSLDERLTGGLWGAGNSLPAVLELYRKFLSLWGNADPLFAAQVDDARRRLSALVSK